MEVLLALVNETEASTDKAAEEEVSHGLPYSLQGSRAHFAGVSETMLYVQSVP